MKKLLAAFGVALIAVTLAAVLLRSASGASPLDVDASELAAQLSRFVGPDGRVTQPLQRPADALDATAWGRRLMHAILAQRLPTPDDEALEDLRRLSPAGGALWADFYWVSALAASSDSVAISRSARSRVMAHMAPNGSFGERGSPQQVQDPAHRVLATWAAVQTLRAFGDRRPLASTASWASAGLRRCAGNDFTRWHLYDTLSTLQRARRSAQRAALGRCYEPLAPGRVRAPADEQELLALVGEALVTQTRPRGTDAARRAALRAALAPDESRANDAWWSWHAFAGYAAAGGERHDYRPVAQRIRGQLGKQGLLPQFTVPSSPLEAVHQAVQIAASAGLPVTTVIPRAALAALPETDGARWQNADHAMWGSTMHQAGISLSRERQAKVAQRATACAADPVTPASFRTVALCARTVRLLGQPAAPRILASAAWRTAPPDALVQLASAVEPAWLPGDLRARVPDAIATVLARPARSATTVLADLPAAATAVGAVLASDDRERLRTEIDARRGRGNTDQLFRMDRSATQVDFAATAAVMTRPSP